MLTKYNIRKSEHIVTKDPMWYIDNEVLSDKGDVQALLSEFIKGNPHIGCTLSVYDIKTDESVEVKCGVADMPILAEYVYEVESNNVLKFVGYSTFANCYIVGTELIGRLKHTLYSFENKKLQEIVQ